MVYTEAYLTQATHGSQSASLELLLSGTTSHVHTTVLPLSNISCPLGPYVPAVMTSLGCCKEQGDLSDIGNC